MPESNTSQNENQRTVQVPAPESGASIAIASEAGGNLNFTFDPANATASRVDNNLVFQVDGGGTVTLEGFFEVGDQSLPTLTLPDGTVVAATDFFAGSDLDLSTAAGPGAGAPGSGGTNYDDDGGALLGGIDRLGSLGTDYWGRGTEITEDADGFTFPAAGIDISIVTDLSDPLAPGMDGSFTNVLFEDGQAYQHLKGHQNPGDPGYDDALTPGQLVMVITPSVGTTIDNVALSGFPQGTRITVDGEDFFLSTGPNDVLNLTYAQSQGTILVFPPVDNTDADYTVNWTVTMSSPGYYGVTESGNFVLVVDAVADKPDVGDAAYENEDFFYGWQDADGNFQYGPEPPVDEDGNPLPYFRVDPVTVKDRLPDQEATTSKAKHYDSIEAEWVKIPVDITFSDVEDGSELHQVTISNIPADWILTGLPNGVQPQPGHTLDDVNNILKETGSYTFVVPGYGAAGADGVFSGTPGQMTQQITGDFIFDPQDWTNERGNNGEPHSDENGDNPYENGVAVYITATADEVTTSDDEATTGNNHASTDYGYHVSIGEDKPDFLTTQVSLLSDETRWVQCGEELNEVALTALGKTGVIEYLKDADIEGLTGKMPVISAAQSTIRYDLHSDGDKDGRDGTGFEAVAGSHFGFKLPEDSSFEIDSVTGAIFSGWTTTAGEKIYLELDDNLGHVLGRTESGGIAFIITATGSFNDGVNNGNVTLIQYEAMQHTDIESHNESLGALGLELIIYDADGDAVAIDISIDIRDDGPRLHCLSEPIVVRLSESDIAPDGTDQNHKVDNVKGNQGDESVFFGKFPGAFDYGSDGPHAEAPFEWTAPEGVLGLNGKELTWTSEVDPETGVATLTGKYTNEDGTAGDTILVITAKGIYGNNPSYTVDQQGPIKHDGEGRDTERFDVTFTIKDGDGDTATGTLTVAIKDDVPVAGKCDITDIVYEKDLRDGSEIHIDGKLTADFGADGPHADTPVFWDQKAVEAELKDYYAIIDGEQVQITEVVFQDDGATFIAYALVGDVKTEIATGRLSLDDKGEVHYDYTQKEPLQHGEHGLSDVARKLDLKYTIMDGDGDTSSNQLDIIVVDSVSWPTADAFHLDESNYNKDTGILSGTLVLDNLDYDAPDGITDVVWNAAWTQKAIDKVTDDILGTALRVEADADDPHILYVYNEANELVITMTLSFNDDTGYYEIAYEQYKGLEHPLGGLFHDDKLALPLVVNSVDGDGDATPNLVAVIVDDDGPRPLVDSNVSLIEGVGNNFVVALYEALAESLDAFKDYMKADGSGELNPDFWKLDTLGENLVESFSSALAEGLKGVDSDAIMDLLILVMGKDYSAIGDTITKMAADDLLGFGLKLVTDPAGALRDVVANLPSDGRTEGDGPIQGALNPNYGFDGPAATDAVKWDANAITLLFNLMGVKATGDEDALHVGSGSTATQLVLVGDSGQPVLTLTLNTDNPSNPSYTIEQHTGLEHSAGSIEQLLTGLLDGNLGGLSEQLNSLISTALEGLGIPTNILQNLEPATLLDILGLSPQTLLQNLGSGNLLTLPLPIIITDGDGDSAPGLITVTIRDSVPSLDISAGVTVAEADLPGGTDYIPGNGEHTHGQDNRVDGNKTEHEETATGTFTYKLGFDAASSVVTIDGINGPVAISAVGDSVQGLYGLLTVTGISSPDGNGNVTVTYSYELTDNVQHEAVQGPNTGQIDPAENFTVTVTDGDGDSVSGNLTVTIIDDVPIATNDFDLVEHADTNNDGIADSWVATGNILTGEGTYGDKALTEDGNSDQFGADGRAVDGGLQIQARDANTAEPLFDDDGNPVWLPVNQDGSVTIQGQYGELKLYGNGSYEYTVDPMKLAEADPPVAQETAWDFTADGKPDGVPNSGFTTSGFASSSALNVTDLASLQTWMTGSDKPLGGLATIPRSAATVATNDGLGNSGTTTKLPLVGNVDLNAGDNEIGNATIANYGITEGVLIAIAPAGQGNVIDLSFGNFDVNVLNTVQETIKVYLFDDQGNLIGTQTVTAGHDFHYEGATGSKIGAVLVVADNLVTSFTVESISSKVVDNIENWQPSENFDYLLTDSDGDTSKATLHIDVNTTPEVLIDSDASHLVVHEDGLADVGTHAGDTDHPVSDTGTLRITSGEGIDTIEIGGLTLTITGVDEYGNVTFATTGTETVGFGDFGVETITRTVEGGQFVYTVEYTYELTDPTTHTDHTIATGRHEGLDGKIEVIVTVTDKNGDTAEGSFTIDIHDDAPVAGNVTFATVYESDVAGSAFVNAGSDASHDMNNQPGDIYREHPEAVDNTGNDQSVFQGNLGLNYGADGPAGSDAFVWTLPGEEMAYLKAMVNGEWRDVEWKRSDDGLTLKGYVALMDGESSIEVEVIKVTGSENGDYTVAVLAGLKHDAPTDDTGEPDQSYDRNMDLDGADDVDATDLTFTYTIKDADGDTATGSLLVNVQDDIPDLSEVNDNAQVKFSGTQIIGEDIVLDFDWQDGSGTLQAGVYDTANGLTLPGGVIVTALDYDGNSASVVVTNGKDGGLPQIGIGVYDATGSDAVKGEIDGRWYDDDNGTLEYRSETLCFKLPEGEVALGLEFSLNHFFKSTSEPDEQGKVEFYLNGEKVGEYVFGAQDSTGAFVTDSTVTFSYPTTGFDEVRFTALDSGGDKAVGADNSDYALSGLKFLSGPSTAVFAMAEGVIEPNYGADGPLISGNFLVLAGLQGVDAAGNAKTATVDGTEVKFVNVNGIIYGYIGDNYNPDSGLVPTAEDLVCMLQFSQLADYTAKWVLTQYKALDKGNELSLSYTAYDGDGDGVTGDVVINVANQMALGMVDNYVFDESNLTHGTAPEDAALTHEVDLPEGYTVDTNGWAGDNANGYTLSVDGGKGMFTYKDGALTYTVLAEHAHPDPTEENEGLAEKLAFTLNLYDEDGNAVLGKLAVDIKDDAPAVEFVSGATGDITDAMAVGAGAGSTDDTLYLKSGEKIGGTINLERGADGATGSVTINGQTVPTTGELTIQGEGYEGVFKAWYENGVLTYSYQADSTTGTASEGVAINDSFTVSYTDADGDTTTDTLYLHSAAQLDLSQTTTDVTVNEANLGWGTKADQPALTKTGVIDVDSQDRDFSITIGHGANSITLTKAQLENGGGDRMLAEADGKGQFAITGYNPATGQLTYTYTLMGKWAHTSGEATDASLDSVFTVSLTDTASGVVTSGDLTVTILDDAPIAADDFAISNGINSSVTGNVLTGDATTTHVGQDKVGADGSGGVVKVWKGGEADIDPDTTPGTDVSGNVKIDGEFGYLTINSGGTYTYTQTKTWDGATAEKFTYQLNDLEGDKDYATLSISFPKEPGTLIVGQNTDDGQDATDHKWVVGDGSGALSGGAGADVISGDTGGASFPPKDYNFVFVLDYSGSMNSASQVSGKTREQLLEEGLTKMIQEIAKYQGGNVTIYLESFATNHKGENAFLFEMGKDHTATVNNIIALLKTPSFNNSGTTNYEAGLDMAATWLNNGSALAVKPIAGAETYSYFISDGEPNTYMNDASSADVGAQAAVDNAKADDGWNGWKYLAENSHLRGIGIGTSRTMMTYINQIDENGAGINPTDADFAKVLLSLNPLKFAEAGDDLINGGAGGDILFGDVLNTDELAKRINLKDASGRDADPGLGWAVFAALEAGTGLEFYVDVNGDVQEGGTGWTRDDTLRYINAHHEELGAESSWTGNLTPADPNGEIVTEVRHGGDDLIIGGAQGDIIYGQEGDDVIFGDNAPAGSENWSMTQWQNGIADYMGGNPTTQEGLAVKAAVEGANESDGNDLIHGGSGDDIIFGGGGGDLLVGGTGHDILFGGSGNDTFAWSTSDFDNGTDKIMDFTQGEDFIRLNLGDLVSDQTGTLDDLLGKISWSADQDNNTLTLTVTGDNSATQTIEVHFDGDVTVGDYNGSFANFYAQNSGNDAAMEALVRSLLG